MEAAFPDCDFGNTRFERAGFAPCGPAGFCFSEGTPGGVCGWLFLARMSALLSEAEAERPFLEREDWRKSKTRPGGHASASCGGLERVPDLGVPVATGGRLPPADPSDEGGEGAGPGLIRICAHPRESAVEARGAGFRVFGVFRGCSRAAIASLLSVSGSAGAFSVNPMLSKVENVPARGTPVPLGAQADP